MRDCVACSAKRDEVLFCIIPGLAAQFPVANLEIRQRVDAKVPCDNRHLCNLVGVVLADPVLDVFADLRR